MNTTLRLFDGYAHTSAELRNQVRELQQALRRKGLNVTVDGHFGPMTQAAVEEFQMAHNLEPTGIVDRAAWAALEGREAPGVRVFETTLAPGDVSMRVHLHAAAAYRPFCERAATLADVPVSIIAGIGSRESGWGGALRPPGPAGTGDFYPRATMKPWRIGIIPPDGGGFGRGLMQIDYDAHEFARKGNWQDPGANILYGGQVLLENRRHMQRKYADRSWEWQLHAALAAYNCGAGNVDRAVRLGRDLDYYTSHRDYGRDVLNKAGWFQINGW